MRVKSLSGGGTPGKMTSKEMMKLLENDRWYLVHVKGSHHHYKHPKKTYHRLLKKAGDTE